MLIRESEKRMLFFQACLNWSIRARLMYSQQFPRASLHKHTQVYTDTDPPIKKVTYWTVWWSLITPRLNSWRRSNCWSADRRTRSVSCHTHRWCIRSQHTHLLQMSNPRFISSLFPLPKFTSGICHNQSEGKLPCLVTLPVWESEGLTSCFG